MVLGLRTKTRKSPTVQLDYLIHVQEVKPWPPSQSLKMIRSVLIQWEHGERNSGTTNPVVPFLGSGIGDGKVEVKESFRLPVTLLREMHTKGGDGDSFRKNCLEFNLYELKRDKTIKGQLLGTAIVDLADYGVVKGTLRISVPMSCKRSFSNAAQPVLFIKIQAVERSCTNLSKETSMERNGSESVSALMSEEYAAEEAEIASITDDDGSSHSSSAVSSSAFEVGPQAVKDNQGETYDQHLLTSEKSVVRLDAKLVDELHENSKDVEVSSETISSNALQGSEANKLHGSSAISVESRVNHKDRDEVWSPSTEHTHEGEIADVIHNSPAKDRYIKEHQENGQEAQMLQDDTRKRVSSGSEALSFCAEDVEQKSNSTNSDRLMHVKSVRSLGDSGKSNGSVKSGKLGDAQNGHQIDVNYQRKHTKVHPIETRKNTSDGRIQQLEHRIKMLEGELREAAAIEVGLYSVVADHGSSINKVHAPARRLSRFYLHACKESSQSRRASAARSAISGLVVVAKACGNDVSRLTFWLSNSVVLRAIITRAFAEHQLPFSAGHFPERPVGEKGNRKKLSPLKWKESSPSNKTKGTLCGSFDDWDDPCKFASALEKIEAWIFSRIVESVWWQTLTPHMQSAAASKTYQRTSSSSDQDQVNISLELWKKAFKDACERICPLRAGGHECGCLPVLPRLIMEQCVARLDVAMFNAILRESDDEIPTDPVSDPISEAKVLPIPAVKASFGAGAQLKNLIGNWSRWLTDLFGIDDGDSFQDRKDDSNDDEDGRKDCDTSFKSFRLLNALSDLMMLPKDMLLSRSIRKEVCPTFGAPLIKRVLNNFAPDEFCPDPIPEAVLEALDIEDPLEAEEGFVRDIPCSASPIVYLPPAAASVAGIFGEIGSQPKLRRSGSSVLKKSYTSDDELDELDSPLSAIVDNIQSLSSPSTKSCWGSTEKSSLISVRYQLLREVWMNSE
ncbi:hypothetical protein RHMOL_Rhmol10G0010200 [Rhododendron molle]|uniref:Uncharacterized protein n=1 Tax=Rhododendron molle TaxID=49168 RepID=A0ACC0LXX4_RHOML|nr:hypothetical protein RHMOL_Rhmol10G0010200 [Rhododendron molle]